MDKNKSFKKSTKYISEFTMKETLEKILMRPYSVREEMYKNIVGLTRTISLKVWDDVVG